MKQVAFPAGHQISKQEEEKKGRRDVSKKQNVDARLFSFASTVFKEKSFQTHLTFYTISICVCGGETYITINVFELDGSVRVQVGARGLESTALKRFHSGLRTRFFMQHMKVVI